MNVPTLIKQEIGHIQYGEPNLFSKVTSKHFVQF